MIWFNAGGKGEGDKKDPSLQFSLLQYAISLPTPFIFMPYTAMIIWGWKMLNCSFLLLFLTNQCATATLHVATLAHANATASYPQDVFKLGERACNANIWRQNKLRDSDSSRNEELERICFCWWLFLHHHAHTYPSVKGNELSPCKISSQSLFTHTEMSRSTAWIQHAWCFTY